MGRGGPHPERDAKEKTGGAQAEAKGGDRGAAGEAGGPSPVERDHQRERQCRPGGLPNHEAAEPLQNRRGVHAVHAPPVGPGAQYRAHQQSAAGSGGPDPQGAHHQPPHEGCIALPRAREDGPAEVGHGPQGFQGQRVATPFSMHRSAPSLLVCGGMGQGIVFGARGCAQSSLKDRLTTDDRCTADTDLMRDKRRALPTHRPTEHAPVLHLTMAKVVAAAPVGCGVPRGPGRCPGSSVGWLVGGSWRWRRLCLHLG
mmetsp:Transcript_99796/g.171972  ORF Transcript_99796/g.171972 Transcript_99796/m.171972 type:complete len:256 (-) Transcript_99796:320-1087(-)